MSRRVSSDPTQPLPPTGPPYRDPPYGGPPDEPPDEPPDGGSAWKGAAIALASVLALAVAGLLIWLLAVRDDDGGSGGISASASALDFGDQTVGQRSPAQTVTVTNDGDEVAVESVAITGPAARGYVLGDDTDCAAGRQLPAGGSCRVFVSFRPNSTGTKQATLSIVTDGADPIAVSLRGTGVGQGALTLETSSLQFGNVGLGGGPATRRDTVTNSGNAPLAFTSIALEGDAADDFQIASATDCSTDAKLAAGDTCTLAVSFSPSELGTRTATLVVETDVQPARTEIDLSGEGTGRPAVDLRPASVAFPGTVVGQSSEPQTVRLENTGNAPLEIAAIDVAGTDVSDFQVGDGGTCAAGASLAAGASCTIEVTFAPTIEGDRSASLELRTNAGSQPQTVELTGAGAPAA
jgi:hypothetical protein